MKHAVITTTIYPPTNLLDWAQSLNEGDLIVVSGDKKTPHDEVVNTLIDISQRTGVMTLYTRENHEWAMGEAVGWNSIQRRNVAILEAIRLGADIITTVDTDNYPEHRASHLDHVREILEWDRTQSITTNTGWYNVGRALRPPVTHRGFPLNERRSFPGVNYVVEDTRVGVHASLWVGDPDIDAIERLHADPVTYAPSASTFTLARDTWCPWNSQSTTYRRELFPLMFVWPHVGRMDDIWPSYVARHVMNQFGWAVAYGAPYVRQERHEHDVVADLEKEIFGYRYTPEFVRRLREIDLSKCVNVLHAYYDCVAQVARWEFIPPQLSVFFDAVRRDLNALQSQHEITFE